MCAVAGAMSEPLSVRAGRAVSSFESVREMKQRMDRPHVASAGEARRHGAADVASSSAHGAGSFSAGGVQTSAQAENRDGQAENGDGGSLADTSQRDETASLRDAGDHPAAMDAKDRGLSALSDGQLAGSMVSKHV